MNTSFHPLLEGGYPVLHADAALAHRIESADVQGQADYIAALNRVYPELGGRTVALGEGAHAFYAGPDSPINRAVGLGMGLAGEDLSRALERMEAFYRECGESPQLDLCPLSDDRLWGLLGDRGYRIRWFINVHFRALTPGQGQGHGHSPDHGHGHSPDHGHGLDHALSLPPTPHGLKVTVARTREERDLWVQTIDQGFSESDDQPPTHPSIAYAVSHRPMVSCFLAIIDGEPAGGAALEIIDGVAHCFSTSTRPRFRGRGVQTALLGARLAAAEAAVCDLAVVMTTPGTPSQRNVERAGFRTAYTFARMIKES